ncbi:hypothetical protein AB0G02_16790 [Actinosynnema sp. NPDC023658]|uniref:hypothetical protein n=1 Tax=Actinosynnema sp. NPDC023658 TaxID=3155465 RepID=UPI0033F7BBEE
MNRRLFGAGLLLAAGVAAVIGTFLPLFWEGSTFGSTRLGFTTTSWDTRSDDAGPELDAMLGPSPQLGAPVVVAAVLLAVAAALVFLPESQRLAARYTAIAATGLLAGSVWATISVAAAALGRSVNTDVGSYGAETGDGVAVLGASVLVAVAGVVLLHARRPERRPAGPLVHRVDDAGGEVGDDVRDDVPGDAGSDDVDTPRLGMPVVEVAQLPESDYRRPDPSDGSA